MAGTMRLEPAPATAATVVHAAAAMVRRDGTAIDLSWQERKLATAIAVQTHPVPTRTLARLLFPDRDDDDAGRSVKVYVYRLRQRISADFIVRRGGGYAVGPDVAVDIVLGQHIMEQLARHDTPIEDGRRASIIDLARELRFECPATLLDSEWWETMARRSRRLGHDLAIAVAQNALRHGAFRAAASIAKELTYEDACDEEAWELLICAQLAHDERAAAFHSFRSYELMLAQELDTVPSLQLRKLVDDARGAPQP